MMKVLSRTIVPILALLLLSALLFSCAGNTPAATPDPTGSVPGGALTETTADQPGGNETPSGAQTPFETATGPSGVPTEPTFTATEPTEPTETPTPRIPLSGIMLSYSELVLTEGRSATLSVRYNPSDATNKTLVWSSDDPSVATVEDGRVTAVSKGTATVTATAEDGGATASCKIMVKQLMIEPDNIRLDQRSLTLYVGDTAQLTATLSPDNVTNKTVVFTSENSAVAKVDANGLVTALRPGAAIINARHEDTWIDDECLVTVNPKPVPTAGVTLNTSALYLAVGKQATLVATVLPDAAVNKNVVFTCDDPSVVAIDGSVLTGLKVGTATVTVTTEEGGFTASCKVTVTMLDEEIDRIDTSLAAPITDPGGYAGGIRKKTTGEILFSPNLTELTRRPDFYDNYSDYTGYIRFTIANSDYGDEGYSFPSFTLQPVKSKGDWVDFFLVDAEDKVFCPVANQAYDVTLVLVKNTDKTKAVIAGTYRMTASEEIMKSPWYAPDYGPGRSGGEFFIVYAAAAHGSIAGPTKQALKEGQKSAEVVAVPDDGYIFVSWSDGVKTAARSGDTTSYDRTITAQFTIDSTAAGIPAIYLYTDSTRPVTSKVYEGASMTLIGSEGHDFEGLRLQIRGRGNSSWSGSASQSDYNSKNSYRIKFDEKIDFLGIGAKNKDWVLNSNKFDLSGLRNYLVWTLANKMGTLPYVPASCFVQLYVNNEYRGMYVVSELIETANGRVEVNDNAATDDKGFLIEFDFRGHSEDKPYFYLPGYGEDPSIKVYDAVELVIKSKVTSTVNEFGATVYDQKEIDAIRSYMLKCHNAVNSGNRAEIDKYIDIPSLIDMYILEELSKDCDVGRASFFVQRSPGGKLFFTAPWDFDFGFGTYGPATSTWGLVSEGSRGVCPWYNKLVSQQWFRQEVIARMNELKKALDETISEVYAKADEIEFAADSNAFFWDLYGKNFHAYVSSQVSGSLLSFEEHVNFLVYWTIDRWDAMISLLNY